MKPAEAFKKGLSPETPSHWVRLVIGLTMFLVGVFAIVLNLIRNGTHDLDKLEVTMLIFLIGGAVAVLFTGVAIEILKIVWPWGKK